MLGKPRDFETVGLGGSHLLDGVVIDLCSFRSGDPVAHQVELAEMHGEPPGGKPQLANPSGG